MPEIKGDRFAEEERGLEVVIGSYEKQLDVLSNDAPAC